MKKIILLLLLSPILFIVFALVSPFFLLHNIIDTRQQKFTFKTQLSLTGFVWDGTFNGNKMPSSDYWFSVEYTEPIDGIKRRFRAHFTLKR